MNVIYLTKGHQIIRRKGTGAITKYGDEAVLAKQLVIDVAKHLWKYHCIMSYTDNDKWTLRKVIAWLRTKLTSSKIAIDFHFNAHHSSKATGVEIIIPKRYNEKELILASQLANTISKTLNINKRKGSLFYRRQNPISGVKLENETQHKRIGIFKNKGINLLIETCFLSNPNDMKSYQENYDALVTNIAMVIANNYV